MIGVVVSRADEASEAIGEALYELGEWTTHTDETRGDATGGGRYDRSDTRPTIEVRTFDDLHLSLTHPERAFSHEPDALVFASRHSGDTGRLLTCHPTGNFGPAEYGGADRSFAPAAPGVQRALLAGFADHAPPDYDVGIECTHHGPTAVDVPAIFAELGSDETAWRDPEGARAVARAIAELPARDATPTVGDPEDPRHLVAVGDGHYAPRFERIVRETPWGVGHVASDWQLDELGDPPDEATIARAVAASDARFAVFAGDYPDVRAALPDDVRVVSETWVREVDDRPPVAVEQLERELVPVDDGLRLGDHATDDYAVRPLPADLLDAALGIDADRTRSVVAAHTVAFETTDNGTRPAGRAAVPRDAGGDADDAGPASGEGAEPDDTTGDAGPASGEGAESDDTGEATGDDALVAGLAGVLREGYETVERVDGEIRASRTAFDPEAARERGVPEGPKFGRLADGEPVTVDGERVPPEAVHRETTDQFPVE